MRISAKGRYALAAVIEMARRSRGGENVSVINIAGSLGISKIYLEQVVGQLKKAGILLAAKGAKGGYYFSRSPAKITAWEVLSALEAMLAEPAESTVAENAPEIETVMREQIFLPLDCAVKELLSGITVLDLLELTEKQQAGQAFMLNM